MELYDTQGRLLTVPGTHHETHESGGADEVSIAGLLGESAELAAHAGLTTGTHGVTGTILGTEDLDNTAGGTDGETAKAPTSNAFYDAIQLQFKSPRNYLINGKIVPSVASNNLTVVIKGLDGNDPSATNPVYCRIGDTIRSITAALSVTKNAGTNWFNSGRTELATREIDYFVYLGYNATDGVVIGFARIPYVCEYSQFSTTTTNEKYCAISTITNAASGDDYEVIGRFAATLSAGAGYTWTVPTFTNINLIQRPVFETRWLIYLPTYSAQAPMTFTDTALAIYRLIYNTCFICVNAYGTTGGVASNQLFYTGPFSEDNSVMGVYGFTVGCAIADGAGVTVLGYSGSTNAVGTFVLRRYDLGNFGIGAARGGTPQLRYPI